MLDGNHDEDGKDAVSSSSQCWSGIVRKECLIMQRRIGSNMLSAQIIALPCRIMCSAGLAAMLSVRIIALHYLTRIF